MNSCNFVGKLIKDVELRYTSTGTATASFTISVYNPFAKGEFKNDLVNVVVWQKTAEACANHLKKGSLCSVETRYSPRSYDNNEGKKVYVHEFTANNVRFLDKREGTQLESQQGQEFDSGKPVDISDDDLPF